MKIYNKIIVIAKIITLQLNLLNCCSMYLISRHDKYIVYIY